MWVRSMTGFLLGTTILMSCGKNNGDDNAPPSRDTIAPAIVIDAPTPDDQFLAGQLIHVDASATDATNVTEMHIHITDENQGKLLRDIHAYPLAKTGVIRDSFPATAGVHYKFRVIAYDAAQNISYKDVFANGN